jgi:hypothetical protein
MYHQLIYPLQAMASSDRTTLAKNLSQYLNQIFSSRPLKFLPIGTVTLILVSVKLLIFINAVTQLSMLACSLNSFTGRRQTIV